jgi:ATP-dependent DNA helicase RecG
VAELTLGTSLEALSGVGPKRSAQLASVGLETVGDLLALLPRRTEDRRHEITIERAVERYRDAWTQGQPAPAVTVAGRLTGVRPVRVRRRRLSLVRGELTDDTGSLEVVWWNRPYLARQVTDAKAAAVYVLHGELRPRGKRRELDEADPGPPQLVSPSIERQERKAEETLTGRIVPIYPAAGEVSPAFVAKLLGQVLERMDLADPEVVPEILPAELLERHGLPSLGVALDQLHRPTVPDEPTTTPAFARLVYGELLELQLTLARVRERRSVRPKEHRIRVDDAVRRAMDDILPFRLTGAQERAVAQIVADLEAPDPMLRLLQGDVGSGKTIVAALALVAAVESGLQAAFMAPTELLAEQQFRSLERLLGDRYPRVLLTGSSPTRAEDAAALARGEARIAVGTHALIQEGTRFERLGLAVIDEQHRFGVVQRQSLEAKGERPDVLVMTATPIPRSLALTVYGDLDLTVIDQLPPGRTPVVTELVPRGDDGESPERRELYRRLAEELAGSEDRLYVVLPLIDESDEVSAASVEREGDEIRRWLAPLPSAVLHGRVAAQERDRIMADFAAGISRVLVATTVIEVGVDVPEATVMVIESAERFGLAQLHQLRGRVGRGERPSRCVALHGPLSETAVRRLGIFAATTDGFRVAEEDLLLRGPGELLGTRQAGLPRFRVADLVRDAVWLERSRRDAPEVLARLHEPGLELLARRVERRTRLRLAALGG